MRNSVLAALALGALCALHSSALPRPTAASFARGAQFEVTGYDSSKSALADFPILVRIADDSPSGFAYSQLLSPSDGADICFIDTAGNGLPFEIDTWNPEGTSFVWVKLPSMEQGTQFVMCWGSATSGKTVCADNPFAGYKGVWHMNATSPADASGSGNDGTAFGNVALTTGVVGSGLSYPNKSSYVSCGSSQEESELTANGYTIEGWVNIAALSGNQALFGKSGFISYRMEGNAVKITTPAVADYGNVGNFITTANEWHYFALSFIPNTSLGAKHYMDGVLKTEQNTGGINNKTGSIEMWLARNQWGNDQGFVGLIDEYRLSPTVRSADWIAADYATQSDPTFLTAGAAEAYEASAAPEAGLVAPSSAVLYTNATLTATIGSLGMDDLMVTDASWVDPRLVVSTNADLSAPLYVLPLSRVLAAPATISVPVVPLATNTTYYAQLQVTNSFGVAGESGVAAFTTRDPQPPAGSILFHSRGFTTLTASATVSDFGTGSESATARVEASTSSYFATLAAASSEAAAMLDTPANYTVPGLTPDTSYYLRLRIVNEWGLVTYVPLDGSYQTRDVPIAATGIGYSFAADNSTVDLTFGVTEVFDGASCSATLVYDGRTLDAKNFTSAQTLSWTGVAAASGAATATVTVTADAGGATYTKTWTIPVTPGSAAVSVSSVSDHVSSATALRLHVGDVATLPELAGTASYTVMNGRFLSLDGNVLTALEPGIVGVKCIDTAGAQNTLAVIVLPEAIGSGSVYVYKETVSTGDRIWTSAAAWEKVGAEGDPEQSDVYPIVPWMVAPITAWDDDWNRYPLFACFDADDRLIRPVYNNTALDAAASDKSNAYVWDKTIQIGDDVTLNSLYLYNENKNKWLGEGRTLTLTSGGLLLHNSKSSIGQPGRTDNGSLVLGDATHPGYVFAKSGSASTPNQIWADVTAPGGFVAAYTGYLTLGGSQTNIADEIAVNAGTLALGDATHACSLAKNLPIRVFANATLSLPNGDSTTGNVLKLDGAAGWFGKVELPSGVTASCKKLYVRDYPETPEWQSLVRGTYGSSESSAEFVRDDLFTGSGVLTVRSDDVIQPTMFIVK